MGRFITAAGESAVPAPRRRRGAPAAAVSLGVLALASFAVAARAQDAPPLLAQDAVTRMMDQMRRNGTLSPAAQAAMQRQVDALAAGGAVSAPVASPPPAGQAPEPVVMAPTPVAMSTPATGRGAMPYVDTGSPPSASDALAMNLMRLLVKQGVISQSAADALRVQAEAASDQGRVAMAANTQSPQSPGQAGPPAGAAPPAGVLRVPYIPQVVRNQIRDDIKRDVLAEAQANGWASPKMLPTWIGKVGFFGDLRFRDEYDLYSKNNSPQLIDYAAFNNNGPIDVNATTNPNGLPYLNTRENRLNQLSIRARFGLQFQPADIVSLTFRLGSGQDNGPVSNTQLLGGDQTKKGVWLDQAYLTIAPRNIGALYFGRVPDLFFHTDLLFDDNLEFDGLYGTTRQPLFDGLKVFATAGVAPLGYVSGSFPTNSVAKTPDSSKWLVAGQVGAEFRPTPSSVAVRAAAALYDYENVAGQLSAPCDVYAGVSQCPTDQSRSAYMQKGNTLFLIRDIAPNPASPLNYAQPQFVGLSYNYREVDLIAELEAPLFGSIRGLLTADYVRNLAYDPARLLKAAAANPMLAPVTNFNTAANGGNGAYQSGNNGFNVRGTVGHLTPSERGDWNVQFGYKYIQPDAAIDAFNSNDFHMGGTNSKGFYIIAAYYFARNTWVDGRWFSATQVYGPPLAIDVVQLELQTRF